METKTKNLGGEHAIAFATHLGYDCGEREKLEKGLYTLQLPNINLEGRGNCGWRSGQKGGHNLKGMEA